MSSSAGKDDIPDMKWTIKFMFWNHQPGKIGCFENWGGFQQLNNRNIRQQMYLSFHQKKVA